MIVYHGGGQAVERPDILHSRKAVDFGVGFYATLEAFFDGFATREQTIDKLRHEQPNLQICFRTQAALNTLEFLGSESV